MSDPDDDPTPSRADGLCGAGCMVLLALWIGAVGVCFVSVMNAQSNWYQRRDAYHLAILAIGIFALAIGGMLGMIWRTSFRPRKPEDPNE